MKQNKTGIFFDGSHTFIGFRTMLGAQIDRLDFKAAEKKLLSFLVDKTETNHKVVYQGWFEGIKKDYFPKGGMLELLRITQPARLRDIIFQYQRDRRLHWALIDAGIEPVWLQRKAVTDDITGKTIHKEKGVDTALSVAVLRRTELFDLETVIVFGNDKDYEPLFHNIRKNGATVITIDCTPVRQRNHSWPRFADETFHYREIFASINDLI